MSGILRCGSSWSRLLRALRRLRRFHLEDSQRPPVLETDNQIVRVLTFCCAQKLCQVRRSSVSDCLHQLRDSLVRHPENAAHIPDGNVRIRQSRSNLTREVTNERIKLPCAAPQVVNERLRLEEILPSNLDSGNLNRNLRERNVSRHRDVLARCPLHLVEPASLSETVQLRNLNHPPATLASHRRFIALHQPYPSHSASALPALRTTPGEIARCPSGRVNTCCPQGHSYTLCDPSVRARRQAASLKA